MTFKPLCNDFQAIAQRQKSNGGIARTAVLTMPPTNVMPFFHYDGYFFFVVVVFFFVVVVFFFVVVVFFVEVVFFVDVVVVTG